MPEFEPSSESFSAEERTAATLRYLQKAVEVMQARLKKDGDVPHWVSDRIQHAAASMGMVVSYVLSRQEREFQAAQREASKPSKSRHKKGRKA